MLWVVIVAINAVLCYAAVVGRRRPEPRRVLARLGFVCLGLLALVSVVAPVIAVMRTFQGVASHIDPAGKARLLAQGISAAMNCSALGMLTCFVPLVTVLVFWLRAPKAAAGSPRTAQSD